MPNIDGILMNPHESPLPEKPDIRYAVCAALAGRATVNNFEAIVSYVSRMPHEFMMLAIKDSTRKDAAIMSSAAFIKVASEYSDLLV